MMIVMHGNSVLTIQRHELNMVLELDYWSLSRQCFGLGTQSKTRYTRHSYDPQYALAAYAGCSRCQVLSVFNVFVS